jgi:hypothetical protein
VRISAALLCDAATVREGLLHMLGGGLNMLRRNSFPAPMAVSLVCVPELDRDDLGQPHKLEVTVRPAQGDDVFGRVEANWEVAGPPSDEGLSTYLPIILPLERVGLPEPGYYRVDIQLDGGYSQSIDFRVVGETLNEATDNAPVG